jgi:hypothetical protein
MRVSTLVVSLLGRAMEESLQCGPQRSRIACRNSEDINLPEQMTRKTRNP